MKQITKIIFLCFLLFMLFETSFAVTISDLTIRKIGENTYLILSSDGFFDFKDYFFSKPPRIVIDCSNSANGLPGADMGVYEIGKGGISTIRFTEYKAPPIVRIVIDLDKTIASSDYVVYRDEGNKLTVMITAPEAPPFSEWKASNYYRYTPATKPSTPTPPTKPSKEKPIKEPPPPEPTTITPPIEEAPVETDKSKEKKVRVEGESNKIDIEFVDADIDDIIRTFSQLSGKNIVRSAKVSTKAISITLKDVTWETAFATILKTNDLDYYVDQETGIIIVTTPSERDKEMQRQAKKTEEEKKRMSAQNDSITGPITKIIEINYAAAKDLEPSLKALYSKSASITLVERANAFAITAVPSVIEAIEQTIVELDTQLPQVNIEARIVEVSEAFFKSRGVEWGWSLFGSQSGNATGKFPTNAPFTHIFTAGYNLDAALSLAENRNELKTLSRPNITTQANKSATIRSGQKVPIITYTQNGPQTNTLDAGINLNVTPQVDRNNRVTMDISASVSSIVAASAGVNADFMIVDKTASTRVTVDNGATTVIGGLTSRDETGARAGIPFLSSLPIVGDIFFSSRAFNKRNQEILVFITPRVIRQPIEVQPGEIK